MKKIALNDAARTALGAGLQMLEKERHGLDLTIDSYNGQDVQFTTLRTKTQWMARICRKEDAKVDVKVGSEWTYRKFGT